MLNPEHGALSFAGTVDRAGKRERFGDQRKGNAVKDIDPNSKIVIERIWPAGLKVKPVRAGQTLDLQVGLWSFGGDPSSSRPVKEFFEVKMAVGKKGKPVPLVAPPH